MRPSDARQSQDFRSGPRSNNWCSEFFRHCVFGFLLQKGGVAKYHILLGVLLLEDLTVIKVMLSAIVVGMLGVFCDAPARGWSSSI